MADSSFFPTGSVAPIAPKNFTVNCPPVGNELLCALWRSPDRFHQIAALDRQTNRFRNIQVNGVTDAVGRAYALSDAGTETYFACAEYLTQNSREAANVSGACSLCMDVDCGEGKAAASKGYATILDAQIAVRQFCIDTGLPEPTHTVLSGGGLHVYWALDRAVDRETWQACAAKLKRLTKAHGLLADDSRTADIASVLRIPGTLNFKYNPPRPVTLLYASVAFIEQPAMFVAIDNAHSRLRDEAAPPRSICSAKVKIPRTIESASAHIRLLQAIVRHIDPDSGYDDWLHVGMALHFETEGSDEGLAQFDTWSSTGAKYRGAKETEAKWRSFRSDPERAYTIRTLIWMAEQEGCSLEAICAEVEPFDICEGQNGTA
jgi:hypothetical protein